MSVIGASKINLSILFINEIAYPIFGSICKQQGKQLKDLASDMDIDASSLTRAMYGNARLDTIEKMAVALGVSVKSLFEPMGDEAVEGFIKIRGKIYQFNCRSELENLLNCKR